MQHLPIKRTKRTKIVPTYIAAVVQNNEKDAEIRQERRRMRLLLIIVKRL